MDIVNDLLVLTHVRNDVSIEASFILVHICSNILHGELDRVAHLLVEFYLLKLILRENILGSAEDAFIAQ